MSTLKVTIVQAELAWHDPVENRTCFRDVIDKLEDDTDLIVLPEMFTTGFTMDAAAYAEPMDGVSMEWLARTAGDAGASVCGSVIIKDDGEFYNRFVCMHPDGSFVCYDKRHLFRLADEQRHYSAGSDFVVFELGGFRVCPMICYDLRFPVWSRNRGRYDLLVYVANWPSRRQHAWDTLLMARAIENQSYLAGVNRTGTDGNDLPYAGGSAIVDFLGQPVAHLGDSIGVATAELDMAALLEFRERFAFHADADDFTLT